MAFVLSPHWRRTLADVFKHKADTPPPAEQATSKTPLSCLCNHAGVVASWEMWQCGPTYSPSLNLPVVVYSDC